MEFHNVEQNLRHSFRLLASDRPAGDVREVGGVSIASAGTAFQMFNAAFLSSPVSDGTEELDRRIATAALHFRMRGLGWSFWVCEGFLPEKLRRRVGKVFERHGLPLAVELPGMCAESVLPPRRKLPAMDFRRVADDATRLAFCDIGCICFHVPMSWFREIFLGGQVWSRDFTGYVGYVEGEPVATAASVSAFGAIGIYNVATLPSHRRLGYGEAIMRHALDCARRETGCERTILQATEHGYPLYLSMGYRTVTTVGVYASE